MFLSYNGISMQIVKVSQYDAVATYDEAGVNYLYDAIDITCECILNPDATTKEQFGKVEPNAKKKNQNGNPPNGNAIGLVGAQFNGDAIGNAIGLVGAQFNQANRRASPVETYQEIARRLAEPRKKLVIWLDSSLTDNNDPREIILESPLPGMVTDARFGPQVKIHNVDGGHGNASIWLSMSIHTDVCRCNEDSKRYLLSNSYSWTVQPIGSNLVAHVIDGTAIFRMDNLLAGRVTADQLRAQFMHPIPPGFQREVPMVQILPGGDAVRYRIVDVEKHLNFIGGQVYHAHEIEVVEHREYGKPQLGEFGGAAFKWFRRNLGLGDQ